MMKNYSLILLFVFWGSSSFAQTFSPEAIQALNNPPAESKYSEVKPGVISEVSMAFAAIIQKAMKESIPDLQPSANTQLVLNHDRNGHFWKFSGSVSAKERVDLKKTAITQGDRRFLALRGRRGGFRKVSITYSIYHKANSKTKEMFLKKYEARNQGDTQAANLGGALSQGGVVSLATTVLTEFGGTDEAAYTWAFKKHHEILNWRIGNYVVGVTVNSATQAGGVRALATKVHAALQKHGFYDFPNASGEPPNLATSTINPGSCPIEKTKRPAAAKALRDVISVLRHPRCANCHGAMDVYAEDTTHPGGREVKEVEDIISGEMTIQPLGREACVMCHDSGQRKWEQRHHTSRIQWANLDDEALCKKIQSNEIKNPKTGTMEPGTGKLLLEHVQHDFLIDLAFHGMRGMGKGSYIGHLPTPEPPPLSKEEFVVALSAWIEAIGARSKWQNGTCCKALLEVDPEDLAKPNPTTPDSTASSTNSRREDVKGHAERAGKTYADLLCMAIDPKSWEGFFDDQSAKEVAAEDAQMVKFWNSHGYTDETSGNTDIKSYWGTKEFKQSALLAVQKTPCGKEMDKQKFPFKDTLNGPLPDVD